MLGLRMIGNCEKCFHRSVCEHKKNFETIEQTDEKNCGFYMPIPLLSEDIILKLLDFNSLYNSSVEVVRCKDCKFWTPMDDGISWKNKGRTDGECEMLLKRHYSARIWTKQNHFCSYGERKES